jgi:hypothetical protein
VVVAEADAREAVPRQAAAASPAEDNLSRAAEATPVAAVAAPSPADGVTLVAAVAVRSLVGGVTPVADSRSPAGAITLVADRTRVAAVTPGVVLTAAGIRAAGRIRADGPITTVAAGTTADAPIMAVDLITAVDPTTADTMDGPITAVTGAGAEFIATTMARPTCITTMATANPAAITTAGVTGSGIQAAKFQSTDIIGGPHSGLSLSATSCSLIVRALR